MLTEKKPLTSMTRTFGLFIVQRLLLTLFYMHVFYVLCIGISHLMCK